MNESTPNPTHEIISVSKEIAGRLLTLETGLIAKQANASVTARYGDTLILATVCRAPASRPDGDFLPLTVDYREPMYAAGKFPGGFFKREGRPTDRETLTSRCIDRPIRPLFAEGFKDEVQLLLKVLSYDGENEADILGMIAAFAALEVSDIPFHGPLGAVRIGRNDGELVVNPPPSLIETGTVNLTIAGTQNAIMMVEGGANEETEEVILDALDLAQQVIRQEIELIEEFKTRCGKTKIEVQIVPVDETLKTRVHQLAHDRIREANTIPDKHERQASLDAIAQEISAQILTEMEAAHQSALAQGEIAADNAEAIAAHKEKMSSATKQIPRLFHDLEKFIMRSRILNERLRSDNRHTDEIRPITCNLDLIPRTHGSALFTRGQTQALVVTTLGTIDDEQKIDGIRPDFYKKFLLQYNFPPFSVGEVRPLRGPGRREIGHGALAERALTPMIPNHEDFPYTIRIVSEILESNGSSSMASVCGGTLALMAAGVPMRSAVAGIAMGLISDGERYAVLSDILGVEDHLGDMDFKVTGTRNGITAFQMDLKIEGITREIMAEALEQARKGRIHILDIMEQAIAKPRENISPLAPRIQIMTVPVEKIRDVIGPGGRMIRKIIQETGTKIDIDDEGRVVIAATDESSGIKAREWIETLTEEVEVGRIYKGKITRLMNFGAFAEIIPGQEGLIHISELAEQRVNVVEDVVKEGDEIDVQVIEIDDLGRINLSKKMADRALGRTSPDDFYNKEKRSSGDRGRGGDRGGRGGDPGRGGDRGGRGGDRGHSGGGDRGGDRGRGRGNR